MRLFKRLSRAPANPVRAGPTPAEPAAAAEPPRPPPPPLLFTLLSDHLGSTAALGTLAALSQTSKAIYAITTPDLYRVLYLDGWSIPLFFLSFPVSVNYEMGVRSLLNVFNKNTSKKKIDIPPRWKKPTIDAWGLARKATLQRYVRVIVITSRPSIEESQACAMFFHHVHQATVCPNARHVVLGGAAAASFRRGRMDTIIRHLANPKSVCVAFKDLEAYPFLWSDDDYHIPSYDRRFTDSSLASGYARSTAMMLNDSFKHWTNLEHITLHHAFPFPSTFHMPYGPFIKGCAYRFEFGECTKQPVNPSWGWPVDSHYGCKGGPNHVSANLTEAVLWIAEVLTNDQAMDAGPIQFVFATTIAGEKDVRDVVMAEVARRYGGVIPDEIKNKVSFVVQDVVVADSCKNTCRD